MNDCLVTIHGVGLQTQGYADGLHAKWINFWGPHDPVADPLDGLFGAFEPQSGTKQPVTIVGQTVDNLTNSPPGGLQAHNYWDNVTQWIPELVRILHQQSGPAAGQVAGGR